MASTPDRIAPTVHDVLGRAEIEALAHQARRLVSSLPVEGVVVIPRRETAWGTPVLLWTGSATSVPAPMVRILREVLGLGADAYVLVHNHLTDRPPSAADQALTRRLTAAGVVVGLPLLAHLVLTPSGVTDCATEQRRGMAD